MTDTAGALERAADLIETIGWAQGSAVHYGYDVNGRASQIVGYCASGALVKSSSSNMEYEVAMAALSCQIRQSTQKNTTSRDTVISWNDVRGRTKSEVVDAMRHAAKDLRNEAVPE